MWLHLICNQGVTSSNLVGGTSFLIVYQCFILSFKIIHFAARRILHSVASAFPCAMMT